MKLNYLIIIAILLIGLFARVVYLDADPPRELSISTDVYTDPPQYTLYAKQFVNTGELNPQNDFRFPLFVYSSVTMVSIPIFKFFGTGILQSNLVGLIYSYSSLLLFFLFLYRVFGFGVSVIFLLIAISNYNLLFYGRLPFLEHAMTFYAFLSLLLITYENNRLLNLIAGISLGVAIFFSKMTGLILIAPFGIMFVNQMINTDNKVRKNNLWNIILFFIGFLIVLLIWYAVVVGWEEGAVQSYLTEQSYSLYGSPDGLKSVDDFLFKMSSFGRKEMLFSRMAVPGILCAVFIILFFFRYRLNNWKEWVIFKKSRLEIFLVILIISFYGALMIWNYRPLRYQLILIYPIIATASILIVTLWNKSNQKIKFPAKVPFLVYPVTFLISMIVIYQLAKEYSDIFGTFIFWDEYRNGLIILSILVMALIPLFNFLLRHYPVRIPPLLAKLVLVVIVISSCWSNTFAYFKWADRPTFTARDLSRDLQMNVTVDALLSGPYAPLLTLENDHSTLIHMFGVSKADPQLFELFPITHLLVDGSNEKLAKRDYEILMDSAVELSEFYVGEKRVRLFRIAGKTGNPIADSYNLSEFERAKDFHANDTNSVENIHSELFLSQYPENLSMHYFLGVWAESAELYTKSEFWLKKAVEFSPTNYVLNRRLADYYQDRFKRSNDLADKNLALEWYEKAIHLAPDETSLVNKYMLFRDREWQKSIDTTSSSQQ